jgi:transcriptional regulator with XRE-family HTH domain
LSANSGLTELREERGMSIGSLAAMAGIRQSTLSSIEAGTIEPSSRQVGAIGAALALSPARVLYLLNESGPDESPAQRSGSP